MDGFRVLLQSLQYPHADSVKLESRNDQINIITWLEDRKIRHLEINEREPLRHYSTTWDSKFLYYLNDLGCPYSWDDQIIESVADCIIWLIEYAVASDYEDCAELMVPNYHDATPVNDISDSSRMVIDDQSELENIDMKLGDSDVDSIGALLGMTRLNEESNPGKFEFQNEFSRNLYHIITII